MAEFPALPLFTDAFLADCGHLDDAETGRYLTLLMHIWRAPQCRIPNDDAWLAKRFRRSIEDVQSQVRPLVQEFCSTDGNWITQKRLRREWDYLQKQREKNSVSAKSRWAKEKSASERNASTSTSGNAPTPTPTPTPKEEREAIASPKKKARTRIDPERQPDEQDRNFAEERGVNVQQEWPRFVNHHVSHGTLSADWHASWRTWCLNDRKFAADRGKGRKPGGATGFNALFLDEIGGRGRERVAAADGDDEAGDRFGKVVDWPG